MKFLPDFWNAGRKSIESHFLRGCARARAARNACWKNCANWRASRGGKTGASVFIQSEFDPELFTSYELWEDQEFVDAYAKMPYVHSFSAEVRDLLEGPVLITRWKIVD